MPLGRRYHLPQPVAIALARVFGEQVDDVTVIEHSHYARVHRGMCATTRRERILLSISGEEFLARPEIVLHEYFHVIRQWRSGRLTRLRYLAESARRGYWNNRFEREARDFSHQALDRYLAELEAAHGRQHV